MVSEVGQRLEQLDPVSQSLVCEMFEQFEKQLWMFELSAIRLLTQAQSGT